ncbi:hypothetical protein [Methanofollis tationis]|uniref:Uncharacterized protein n=1 Tax=Methanofollis tationis TaxID=81417 RepID=A0A7K4HQT4_9EURY|nr:hypothetical protein [Methanofollis tationis]NVO67616.1 hypothetical protein [Methanofollis tationis]
MAGVFSLRPERPHKIKIVEEVEALGRETLAHVLVAEDVLALRVDRGIGKEGEAHPGMIVRRAPNALAFAALCIPFALLFP